MLCVVLVKIQRQMSKSFVLHDESVNTRGFRMLTSGANLDEFRKNPVMLYMHNDWEMPIGRWENIRVENGCIMADPVFDDKDPKACAVRGKVERDFIRMASVGSWPPEEFTDDPLLKLNGQTMPTVTKWTVREASIVPIGSNHNAMVFYDRTTGKPIDLDEPGRLIKLMDITTICNPNKKKMDELDQLLNLADTASEADRTAAIIVALNDRDRLKSENQTLQHKIDEQESASKLMRSQEAVNLIDAAVLDGRIDAKGKETFVKLFDLDFDSAKASLEAIPPRGSVIQHIEKEKEKGNVDLSDLQKLSWEQLDKAGKLVKLRDQYPDLYSEKFEQRFGCKPNIN
jgi:hypothetical protein